MRAVGVLFLIFGAFEIVASFKMFGDIGIAAGIAAFAAILLGIGFLIAAARVRSASLK